jgi:hypothetical protein
MGNRARVCSAGTKVAIPNSLGSSQLDLGFPTLRQSVSGSVSVNCGSRNAKFGKRNLQTCILGMPAQSLDGRGWGDGTID